MFPARFEPQFSESVLFRRFPALFRRFPALCRRFLSSECSMFPMFFLVYLCSFHDNIFFCIHFRCLLERCCKCQNATQNSSVLMHFVGTDSLADRSSHAEAMPPVLGDVTLLRFGRFTVPAVRQSRYWNQTNVRCHCYPSCWTIYRTEKKEKRGLQQKRLSKAKNASDQLGGAADPPFGVFSCRWVFPGMGFHGVSEVIRSQRGSPVVTMCFNMFQY